MSRTPKQRDTTKRAFSLSHSNIQHLQRLVRETRRDLTQMINTELEYVRGFGLPQQFLRRLEAAAAHSRASLRDEVKTRLNIAAASLPAAAAPSASVLRTDRVQSSANIYGPNDVYLQQLSNAEGRSYNEALNRELEFAQDYGLTPQFVERLRMAAAHRRISLRDQVFEVLVVGAMALPDPVSLRRA